MFDVIKLNTHNKLFKKIPEVSQVNLKRFHHPIWFEIRGTNGSGKSTVPFMMQELDPMACVFKSKYLDPENHLIDIFVSGFPSFRTLVVGSYPKGRAVGGVDTINGTERIEQSLRLAKQVLERNPEYERVMFEGIMTSTSNTRWVVFVSKDLGVATSDLYVAWCNTPLDICMQRITGRSGRDFNDKYVKMKFQQMKNQPPLLSMEFPGMSLLEYDCMCEKDQMVENWKEFKFAPIVCQ